MSCVEEYAMRKTPKAIRRYTDCRCIISTMPLIFPASRAREGSSAPRQSIYFRSCQLTWLTSTSRATATMAAALLYGATSVTVAMVIIP